MCNETHPFYWIHHAETWRRRGKSIIAYFALRLCFSFWSCDTGRVVTFTGFAVRGRGRPWKLVAEATLTCQSCSCFSCEPIAVKKGPLLIDYDDCRMYVLKANCGGCRKRQCDLSLWTIWQILARERWVRERGEAVIESIGRWLADDHGGIVCVGVSIEEGEWRIGDKMVQNF